MSRPMVIVDEEASRIEEPPPHGAIGMSTAWRISDAVSAPRGLEFRKRMLHVGAAIGLHRIEHDEVYYVLSGVGEVRCDGGAALLQAGMTAYLFKGSEVGIWQRGDEPLTIIVSYPNLV